MNRADRRSRRVFRRQGGRHSAARRSSPIAGCAGANWRCRWRSTSPCKRTGGGRDRHPFPSTNGAPSSPPAPHHPNSSPSLCKQPRKVQHMKTHPRLTSYFDGAIDDLAVELGAAIQAQIRDAGDIGIGTVRLRLADALSVLRGDFIAGRPIDDDAPSSPPEPEYVITTRNYENVTTTGDPLAPVPVRYLVAFCPLWDDNAEQAARSLELYISARWALDSIAVYPADVLDVPAAPATPAEEAIDAIATRRARLEHLLDAPFTFGAEEELREAIRAATSELADAVDRYVAVIQNGAGE